MPSTSLAFRSVCGTFAAVYAYFMEKRARFKAAMRVTTLKMCSRLDGVTVGLLLSLMYFANLLYLSGDIELNPGPPKNASTRQSRLTSAGGIRGNSSEDLPPSSPVPAQSSTPALRNLDDVMDTLLKMNSDLNSKLDSVQDDVRQTKDVCSSLREEMLQLKGEVADLRKENAALKKTCDELNSKVDSLEKKNDDVENRMKRNNIIIHGMPRDAQEKTWQDCEGRVRDLVIDTLELSGEVTFERVHRLSPRNDSPIVAMCTLFKDKEEILRARNKLKGSKIFIGEDFSKRVRDIRKRLLPHLKEAKASGKRASMVFDHLIIDGKRFGLTEQNKLVLLK